MTAAATRIIDVSRLRTGRTEATMPELFGAGGLFAAMSADVPIPPIAVTEEVRTLLDQGAVVSVSVSGGKDSDATAVECDRYLDSIGHTGPRILIHSDLGSVEWEDSMPAIRRLTARLGARWKLVVLRRAAGGMMKRWQVRWANNVARYIKLECVKLIMPWSSPAQRFCTSELKTQLILRYLRSNFVGQHILNVTGIRGQESEKRRNRKISKPLENVASKGFAALEWNPLIKFTVEQVFSSIRRAGLQIHQAYLLGCTRVSCVFCIFGDLTDFRIAARVRANQAVLAEMAALELESGFSFKSDQWLADVAAELPDISPGSEQIAAAKQRAAQRAEIEVRIPKELLYEKGWPTRMITMAEAALIAQVRREVGALYGFAMQCTTAEAVFERYAGLIAKKVAREAAEKAAQTRREERAAAKAAKAGAKPGGKPAGRPAKSAQPAVGAAPAPAAPEQLTLGWAA